MRAVVDIFEDEDTDLLVFYEQEYLDYLKENNIKLKEKRTRYYLLFLVYFILKSNEASNENYWIPHRRKVLLNILNCLQNAINENRANCVTSTLDVLEEIENSTSNFKTLMLFSGKVRSEDILNLSKRLLLYVLRIPKINKVGKQLEAQLASEYES